MDIPWNNICIRFNLFWKKVIPKNKMTNSNASVINKHIEKPYMDLLQLDSISQIFVFDSYIYIKNIIWNINKMICEILLPKIQLLKK